MLLVTDFLICRNIRLLTPYPVEEEHRERSFTYLDTVGRPVVIAKKSNLVEEHILDFQARNGLQLTSNGYGTCFSAVTLRL